MIPNRVVIDTNVCLDLFVFRDPRWSLLHEALKNGAVEAVTRADCKMEWHIVLGYKHLPLEADSRAQSAAEYDALISCIDPAPRNELLLPKCSDTDDQKFLELARDAQASILITKDKALLKLARRISRLGMFSIILPEVWKLPLSM